MCNLYTFEMTVILYITGMNILITGANGFLGQHLCRSLRNQHKVIASGKGLKRIPFEDVVYVEADISSGEEVENLLRFAEPEVIIHTAAMSKPDECEKNKALCIDINVKGTQHIVEAAKTLNKPAHLIYTSSDFVLGDDGPHTEDAIPVPLNFYGETKLAAEKIVEESGLLYSIVRPVFMYGEIWEGMRPTFLHWVKESLENGKRIKVVCDQLRTPTYVVDICKGIHSIIKKKAGGLYHLAGEELLTPYDMAVKLAIHLQLDISLIEAVTTATFRELVQRAKKGGLIIHKAKDDLGFVPLSFHEALDSYSHMSVAEKYTEMCIKQHCWSFDIPVSQFRERTRYL